MKKLDVVGFGTAFVDYFFDVDKSFLRKYNLSFKKSSTLEQSTLTPQNIFKEVPLLAKSQGGNTPNTLRILSEFKISVGYYGVVGKDREGDYWYKNIGKRIDKSHIMKKGKMTICACLIGGNRKERGFIFSTSKYENDFFSTLDTNYISSIKLLYISPLYFDPLKAFKKTQRIVNSISGPQIAFSPGFTYCLFGIKKLLPILKKTRTLFVNEEEIQILTGKRYKQAIAYLIQQGVGIVVCTLGEKGAFIASNKEQIHVPAYHVKQIIDTTGAGDAFAAGFLYGVLKDKSLRECGLIGAKVASLALSDFGLLWLKKTDFKTVLRR